MVLVIWNCCDTAHSGIVTYVGELKKDMAGVNEGFIILNDWT
jgi:nicotinamide mononucleotide (NMN) deamidase PncC